MSALPEQDKEGFLLDPTEWDESIAEILAEAEGIELTEAHWELVRLTRRFYEEFELSPAMRPLVKFVKQNAGSDKGRSVYLMRLFPGSPAKLLSKIAGLPKPDNCL